MPPLSLNLPKWTIEELDRHVAAYEEYDNRTHLIRVLLAQWLTDNREDLEETEEELDDDDDSQEE